jgi:predicted RNase H-like nuclease (RuvC/YqgF family)
VINVADQGNFRKAINGFNKTDVLEYIDSMQARYSDDLAEYQKQVSELKDSLNTQKSENSELKSDIEQLRAEIDSLSKENVQLKQTAQDRTRYAADLRRLAKEVETLRLEKNEYLSKIAELQAGSYSNDELNRQVEQLRAQVEANSAVMRSDSTRIEEAERTIKQLGERNEQLLTLLKQEKSHAESLEKKLAEMSETNKKYNGLVGDAGNFILEMYSMGQRFLEIAYKRSDGCLESMEQTLETLTAQIAQAGERVKNARQELLDYGALAGLRLDELMQSLELSAGIQSDSFDTEKTM